MRMKQTLRENRYKQVHKSQKWTRISVRFITCPRSTEILLATFNSLRPSKHPSSLCLSYLVALSAFRLDIWTYALTSWSKQTQPTQNIRCGLMMVVGEGPLLESNPSGIMLGEVTNSRQLFVNTFDLRLSWLQRSVWFFVPVLHRFVLFSCSFAGARNKKGKKETPRLGIEPRSPALAVIKLTSGNHDH